MTTGPGLIPTFLYYFVVMTLITAFVVSQQTDISLATGAPYQVGILFGLLAGLTGAYFNRNVSITAAVSDAKAFNQTLTATLSELGFEKEATIDSFTVYKRSALSGLFTTKVLVEIEAKAATISGRSHIIKQLQQRLKV
ncbi:hypothetical protein H6F86_15150 [Phormidium sp. FACHB-592]|uniref:Uncharacterized protein n=1 Tax=Stenomitos frigidus AS-A4 TaxID=2933935 RepID=A0ABV0KSE5_9CYAN|nr:hypothetical protein [Phormidium sp. FACHB-592]MBD2075208.1 hypothetical protein [Phormidium sp. FACHB-592]